MSRIYFSCILLTCITTSYVTDAHDLERPANNPSALTCPHCGEWEISHANRSALVGEKIFIDDKKIKIPNCGEFSYETKENLTKQNEHDFIPRSYKIALSLKKTNTYFLCKPLNSENLEMLINITGHFREGGTADMRIKNNETEKVVFSAFAWNTARELPGDAGSGFGSASAEQIAFSHIYKALAAEVDASYRRYPAPVKAATFNVARFSTATFRFCQNRERESGGGSWPYVWAMECQLQRLIQKTESFIEWQDCMDTNKGGLSRCKFPDERYDKSQKQE